MEKRTSRQQNQYTRLKGATKILSDEPMEQELTKQETIVDSSNNVSTTTNLLSNNETTMISSSNMTSIHQLTNMNGIIGNDCHSSNQNQNQNQNHNHHHHNQQQQQQQGSNNDMLYITCQQSEPHCVTLPSSSSSTSKASNNKNNSSSSSTTTFNTNCNNQNNQQSLGSPQILPCDIKSLFECPICFDYAVPPIYQCQNGHLVCQNCSQKITHCPTCRVPISEPSIRNLQLDRLANTFQFPCKYNFNGCQWKSYWFKKREHEEDCDYISYSCPCPGTICKWTGLLSQVMPHLSEFHRSVTTLIGEDIVFLATDINLKGAVDWVMIQSCFNQHFLLVLEKQELKNGQQQFFAVVQLIGSQKEAEKYKYKLELTTANNSNVSCGGGKTVKRLLWEATPRSILDGIQVAITNFDCLVFDAKLAQHFLSPNIQKDKKNSSGNSNDVSSQGENLGINVTIERVI